MNETDYMIPVYAGIAALINAACPEVNGILEAEHSSMIPWETLPVPFAVILFEDLPGSTDFGSTNDVYTPILQVFYVAEVRGPVGPIRHALMRLRDKFRRYPDTDFQMMGIDGMEWSDELEPNKLFSAKNMPHRAGKIDINILFGAGLPELDPHA